MKATICSLLLALCLFAPTQAQDPEPEGLTLTVTGLVTGPRIKNGGILNDRIVFEGDTLEIVDGKIRGKVVPGGRVRVNPEDLMTVISITEDGMTLRYKEWQTLVPLKKRTNWGLTRPAQPEPPKAE